MYALFRQFVLTLLGIAFAAFGIYHAIVSYPSAVAFTTVSRELPTIVAVASFWFGIALVLLGAVLLIPLVLYFWRARSQKTALHWSDGGRQSAPREREQDWDLDPDVDPYAYDVEEDDHDGGRRRSGHASDRNGHPSNRSDQGITAARNSRSPASARR
jgi:hypothetical protein